MSGQDRRGKTSAINLKAARLADHPAPAMSHKSAIGEVVIFTPDAGEVPSRILPKWQQSCAFSPWRVVSPSITLKSMGT